MANETVATLDGVPLLKELSQKERDDLVRHVPFSPLCRWRAHHRRPEPAGARSIFVVAGMVRVVNYSPVGPRGRLRRHSGSGNFFGELAALDGGPRSAFVQAQAPGATAAAMPHEVFIDLLHAPSQDRYGNHAQAGPRHPLLDRAHHGSLDGRAPTTAFMPNCCAWPRRRAIDGNSSTISPIPHHADIASRVSHHARDGGARLLRTDPRRHAGAQQERAGGARPGAPHRAGRRSSGKFLTGCGRKAVRGGRSVKKRLKFYGSDRHHCHHTENEYSWGADPGDYSC